MNLPALPRRAVAAAASLLLALAARDAFAGPPLVCFPLEIGSAESLPWGSGAFDEDETLPKERVTGETIRILQGSPSALVHMETLRRAAVLLARDESLSRDLLSRLMARVLDAEARGRETEKADALAWFDAGYLVQCLHQMGVREEPGLGAAGGVAGYAWVRHAIALRGDDAEMELGAAMMTVIDDWKDHEIHAARARALAPAGSLAAQNLASQAAQVWVHFAPRDRD